jgi:hypothetical protein
MLGWAIGPPEEREYAVLPVGVARISPSAWKRASARGPSNKVTDLKAGVDGCRKQGHDLPRPRSSAGHSQTHPPHSDAGTVPDAAPPRSSPANLLTFLAQLDVDTALKRAHTTARARTPIHHAALRIKHLTREPHAREDGEILAPDVG